jgi:hypothetical protein
MIDGRLWPDTQRVFLTTLHQQLKGAMSLVVRVSRADFVSRFCTCGKTHCFNPAVQFTKTVIVAALVSSSSELIRKR